MSHCAPHSPSSDAPHEAMANAVILLDRPSSHVARLRIHRPDKLNAIDFDVRQQMSEHLQTLMADSSTRAIVLGGSQGILSAGGDVPSMIGLSLEQARERMQHVHVLCRLVAGAPVPVITAMEGVAAGAAVGLALLGDHIVAGPSTRVLFPFLKLGLVPDWGQLLTLPRRIGVPAARRLLTSGNALGGEEAFRIGLVDTFVPDDDVMATAISMATELSMLPLEAFRRMKSRLNDVSVSIVEELAREENDQAICLLSDEFQEGFQAFLAKRPPDFINLLGAMKP